MKTSRALSLLLLLCLSIVRAALASEDEVVVYPALTVADSVVIDGRVVERKTHASPSRTDSRRTNMRRAWSLMINDERRDHPVTVTIAGRKWLVRTDHEGYFQVHVVGLNALAPGWHDVMAHTESGVGVSRLLKVPVGNTHGIISDVDDTILVTEVNSKRRMLANTFFYNALQREVVPGIVDLYMHLAGANPQPEYAPIIYLSASPKQLHTSIDAFLAKNEFVPGVLITKRVTDDRTSEPLRDQVSYKTAKIEAILASCPDITFTLVGDDGEFDPEIYADIARRFPKRVSAILIRKVNPDPARAKPVGQDDLDEPINRLAQTGRLN